MKKSAASVTLAIIFITCLHPGVCTAEMPMQISVFQVVNLFSGQLESKGAIAIDSLDPDMDLVFKAMQPEGPARKSIFLSIPAATFDQVALSLRNSGLASRYYEIRAIGDHGDLSSGSGPVGKMGRDSRNRTEITIDPPSPGIFVPDRLYMVTVSKTGYQSDSIDFRVSDAATGTPTMTFSKDRIHLVPDDYRQTGFILETTASKLSPSDKNRLRESIGGGLEDRHHKLTWLRQYRSMAEILTCIRERPPFNPAAQMNINVLRNQCSEDKFNYLIRITPVTDGGGAS